MGTNSKHFTLLIFILLPFLLVSQQKTENKIYDSLDDWDLFVYFSGGKDGKTSDILLQKYIKENIIYPDSAYKAKIEGKVLVTFSIDSVGKISDVKIIKGSYTCFNKEVLRLISTMPNWVWDKKVKVTERKKTTRTLPVNFSLRIH